MALTFPSVTNYLNDIANSPDSAVYELQKLLAYRGLLTDPVLATNNWEFKEGMSGWGVYVLNTYTMVPHKDARQWLKYSGYRARETVNSGEDR